MSKLVIIAVIVVICGVVWADFEPENRPNMRRLAPVICGSKVSDSQKKIIENCAKLLPSSVRNGYKSCVKDVLKVSKMTKPGLCYRIQPGGEKLIPCLKRKAQAAAKKLPPGTDIAAMRKQIGDEYEACMLKLL